MSGPDGGRTRDDGDDPTTTEAAGDVDHDPGHDGHDGPDGGGDPGGTTQTSGTPMAVDMASAPSTRLALAMFVAAPTIWFTHFMVVYLVAEAGCTGGGPGLSLLDPPVPAVVTLVATAVAVAGCAWVTWWEYREWRGGRRLGARDTPGGPPGGTDLDPDEKPLAFAGVLIGLISAVSVLFVGLPAIWLTGC